MWKVIQLQKLYVSFKTSVNRIYEKAFKEHLLLTNTVTLVSLFGVGDIGIQTLEQLSSNTKFNYDYKRTARMVLFATLIGPPQHLWYMALDKYIVKGALKRIVGKKVLADQVVYAPLFYVAFFGVLGTLERKSISEIKSEFKEMIVTLYATDCSVWPAVQAMNFYLIPNHFRVLYINTVWLLWNTYLSFMKHKGKHEVVMDVEIQPLTDAIIPL